MAKSSDKSKSVAEKNLFLGLDASTQGLEATVIDDACRMVYGTTIHFDADLPEFKTTGGVHRHPDGLTVTAPTLMWVAALDLLLERMQKEKVPLEHVAAVSGSGQQHGSVYLCRGFSQTFKAIKSDLRLQDQLNRIFTVDESPVWMDSSTNRQCQERDAALGGPQAVADLTGSRSFERFTGNQIAKIYQEHPELYKATDRIALVSSFMASLLIGEVAPIEPGDGAGMNLMDIRTRHWSKKALDCTAPDLERRLGSIVPSHSVVGKISLYYVKRYGFTEDCLVIAFSGDNPNSLAAMRLEHGGDIAISMGTGDTVFGALSECTPSATTGHIFGNPINPEGYMALVCFKNGSLTREYVRNEFAGRSWDKFEAMLIKTPAGNRGNIGFYFKDPEITPPILTPGIYRFRADNTRVDQFTPEENVRAVVEAQFLSIRLHGSHIGLVPKTILATGGASVNRSILRIISDVFGVSVFICKEANSASLGAAYRALHGWHCNNAKRFISFTEVLKQAVPFIKAVDPDTSHYEIYTKLMPRYMQLEQSITSGSIKSR